MKDSPRTRTVLIGYLLVLSTGMGFSMMVLEVTAPRLLAPYFGSSNYLWTNVIGSILAALAGGYYLGGKIADRWPRLSVAATWALIGGVLATASPPAAAALSEWLAPRGHLDLSSVPTSVSGSLLVTVIAFVPPILIVGGLSPMIVRLLSLHGQVGWASGAVSATTTLGAVLGTFAPTLWLIPAIGSRMTVLTASVVAASVGLLGLLLCGLRRETVAAAAVCALAWAGLWLQGSSVIEVADSIDELETAYQYACVRQRDGVLELHTDSPKSATQSVLDQDRYLTDLYFDDLSGSALLTGQEPGQSLDVLVLGLAGGTVSRQIHHFLGNHYELDIDGVEIDPWIVELGRRHFGLGGPEHPTLEIFALDGRRFLRSTTRNYDLIVIDVFSHGNQVPWHMASREFFELVRARLAPGGLMTMNVVLPSSSSELGWAVLTTIGEAFDETWFQRRRGTWNVQVLAPRDGSLRLDRGRARIRRLLTTSGSAEAVEFGDNLLERWTHLVKLRPEMPGEVLTDDWAPTEHLARMDAARVWSR
jgi:predicted membrane-bound spermidine synthase